MLLSNLASSPSRWISYGGLGISWWLDRYCQNYQLFAVWPIKSIVRCTYRTMQNLSYGDVETNPLPCLLPLERCTFNTHRSDSVVTMPGGKKLSNIFWHVFVEWGFWEDGILLRAGKYTNMRNGIQYRVTCHGFSKYNYFDYVSLCPISISEAVEHTPMITAPIRWVLGKKLLAWYALPETFVLFPQRNTCTPSTALTMTLAAELRGNPEEDRRSVLATTPHTRLLAFFNKHKQRVYQYHLPIGIWERLQPMYCWSRIKLKSVQ